MLGVVIVRVLPRAVSFVPLVALSCAFLWLIVRPGGISEQ
jgi:hypothetical protein